MHTELAVYVPETNSSTYPEEGRACQCFQIKYFSFGTDAKGKFILVPSAAHMWEYDGFFFLLDIFTI